MTTSIHVDLTAHSKVLKRVEDDEQGCEFRSTSSLLGSRLFTTRDSITGCRDESDRSNAFRQRLREELGKMAAEDGTDDDGVASVFGRQDSVASVGHLKSLDFGSKSSVESHSADSVAARVAGRLDALEASFGKRCSALEAKVEELGMTVAQEHGTRCMRAAMQAEMQKINAIQQDMTASTQRQSSLQREVDGLVSLKAEMAKMSCFRDEVRSQQEKQTSEINALQLDVKKSEKQAPRVSFHEVQKDLKRLKDRQAAFQRALEALQDQQKPGQNMNTAQSAPASQNSLSILEASVHSSMEINRPMASDSDNDAAEQSLFKFFWDEMPDASPKSSAPVHMPFGTPTTCCMPDTPLRSVLSGSQNPSGNCSPRRLSRRPTWSQAPRPGSETRNRSPVRNAAANVASVGRDCNGKTPRVQWPGQSVREKAMAFEKNTQQRVSDLRSNGLPLISRSATQAATNDVPRP